MFSRGQTSRDTVGSFDRTAILGLGLWNESSGKNSHDGALQWGLTRPWSEVVRGYGSAPQRSLDPDYFLLWSSDWQHLFGRPKLSPLSGGMKLIQEIKTCWQGWGKATMCWALAVSQTLDS